MKQEERFMVENGAGWTLDLRRFFDPDVFDARLRPVVMVPGYAMNSFILNYHPTGESMIGYLVKQGFEVWATNLRGQGESRVLPWKRRRPYGFRELALEDLPAALRFVQANQKSEAKRLDLAGMSLGAPISYAYLAHYSQEHSVGGLVAVGGPLKWTKVHPLVRQVMRSERLVGLVPVRGTRRLARLAIPIAMRMPKLLSVYMNPEIIDLSKADELVKTVDDPEPQLNREIARWIKRQDLMVAGRNISEGLRSVETPLYCIIAGQDGIVTPESALSVLDHIGADDVEVLEVGSEAVPHAHADLFISEGAEEKVFRPLAQWLLARNMDGEYVEKTRSVKDAGTGGS